MYLHVYRCMLVLGNNIHSLIRCSKRFCLLERQNRFNSYEDTLEILWQASLFPFVRLSILYRSQCVLFHIFVCAVRVFRLWFAFAFAFAFDFAWASVLIFLLFIIISFESGWPSFLLYIFNGNGSQFALFFFRFLTVFFTGTQILVHHHHRHRHKHSHHRSCIRSFIWLQQCYIQYVVNSCLNRFSYKEYMLNWFRRLQSCLSRIYWHWCVWRVIYNTI